MNKLALNTHLLVIGVEAANDPYLVETPKGDIVGIYLTVGGSLKPFFPDDFLRLGVPPSSDSSSSGFKTGP